MILFSQRKAFYAIKMSFFNSPKIQKMFIKMSFYYRQKICIFLKRLTRDYGQKFQIFFWAFYSVKETLVLSFGDVIFSKGGFFDDKNVILL